MDCILNRTSSAIIPINIRDSDLTFETSSQLDCNMTYEVVLGLWIGIKSCVSNFRGLQLGGHPDCR